MGMLVTAAMAAQHAATSSGSSIRLAPKQPAPATFSLRKDRTGSHAQFDVTGHGYWHIVTPAYAGLC